MDCTDEYNTWQGLEDIAWQADQDAQAARMAADMAYIDYFNCINQGGGGDP